MIFRFYKELDERWYIDLPDWIGSKADLEMVAGADVMLNYMSDNGNEVTLKLSEEEFENSDKLEFVRMALEIENGAFYYLKEYQGVDIDLEMWLCDVTKFVFGYFPQEIYISVVD
jgi:hypothetical protein